MFEKLTKIIMFFVIFFTLIISNNRILSAQTTNEDDQFQEYDMYNDIRKDIPISEDESISEFPEDQYANELSSWMKKIPDDTLIGDLSIPGSHDSATYKKAPAITCPDSTVRCQRANDTFLIQMEKLGIRAFDLRLKEDMQFFHGRCWLELGLREYIKDVKQFLTLYNQEFIIAHVKHEHGDCEKKYEFYNNFIDIVKEENAQDMFLYLGKDLLTTPIGKLRGKVVVITRKRAEGDCGWIKGATMIDFPDDDTVEHTDTTNCENCIDAAISDDYTKRPYQKVGPLTQHMARATDDNDHRMYIGFVSGYKICNNSLPYPEGYSTDMLPSLRYVIHGESGKFSDCCKSPKGQYRCPRSFTMPPLKMGKKLGTVFIDFVGEGPQFIFIMSDIIPRNPG
ncbi:MAG: hypothetical protein HQK79_16260 [Desulfobacterales bacterium]|nr:hypothetical protein [Desulfobacterales bacterium]